MNFPTIILITVSGAFLGTFLFLSGYLASRLRAHNKRVLIRQKLAESIAERLLKCCQGEVSCRHSCEIHQGKDKIENLRLISTEIVPIIFGKHDCRRVFIWCVVHVWNSPFKIEIFCSHDSTRRVMEFAENMKEYLTKKGNMVTVIRTEEQPKLEKGHKVVPMVIF